jgi:hypothetical protein
MNQNQTLDPTRATVCIISVQYEAVVVKAENAKIVEV